MSLEKKQRNIRLLELAKTGLSYREIAKLLDMTRQRVHQIYRRSCPQPVNKTLDRGKDKV